MSREPCPDRVIHDAGSAFAMGYLGGGLWHMIKGVRNTPKLPGVRFYRFQGGLRAAAKGSLRVGGGFGVWGFLFSTYDCALHAIRHKDDIWNPVMAGGLVGATLAARGGLSASLKAGAVGCVFLGIIEGISGLMNKAMTKVDYMQASAEQRQTLAQRGQLAELGQVEPPSQHAR